ncbi:MULTISPECIES: HAD family hydrolase [unclassified Streptomyces]|uniref:HAD family hydrolase n=1 Tax=unclassified Streptomyces TaxID=2593676 RepID=UPI0006ADC718|nr:MULTISPECIES: HAD-IA family hydrolase [unclassified Streptomyces]KOX36252.1 hydrolase [Streptomyces sp. NRRL F-6491]KOX51457.1 hydrolase [Streptomyces sp. NRRL F-6492]
MSGRREGPPPPRAVVLDTDGVLLDSATAHAAAWKTAFDACLAGRATGDAAPFDADAEYRRFVDGRSRHDGAEAFLTARGIRLPPGSPGDPPGRDTVWAVAARKEAEFRKALAAGAVAAFPDAAEALTALRALRVPCAAVSASRHARTLLADTGLDRLLADVVDGVDAARLALPGKPDPALFLHAAARLGTRPGDTAVVEDALAGVRAARRGGFDPVVGLDRAPNGRGTAALREEGADTVVPDLVTLVRETWGGRP